MGIDKWGPFAINHGIVGTKIDSTQTKMLRVEIDVLAMYYWVIVSTLHDDNISLAKRALNIDDYTPLPGEAIVYASPQGYTIAAPAVQNNRLANIINHRLLQHFTPGTGFTRLHIDGKRTMQKQAEHRRRDADLATKLADCQTILASHQALVTAGSRSKGTNMKKFWSMLKACRVITDQDKHLLVQSLRALNWRVCECTGEADVCIAKATDNNNNLYAVSRDSDLFFHATVKNILRPYKGSFLSYTKDGVMRALDLSKSQLKLLSMVSKTDYATNVPGYALERNLGIIKRLPTHLTQYIPNNRYVANNTLIPLMLQRYKNRVGQNIDTTHSEAIFLRRAETLLNANDEATHQNRQRIHIRTYRGALQTMLRIQAQRAGTLPFPQPPPRPPGPLRTSQRTRPRKPRPGRHRPSKHRGGKRHHRRRKTKRYAARTITIPHHTTPSGPALLGQAYYQAKATRKASEALAESQRAPKRAKST
ncbi:hypothetical protein BGX34_006653, partial [Mortierella sp. NVP85]